MSKRTSIVQTACARFLKVATQRCLVLNIRHLILIVGLFEGVLVLVLLGLLRLLVATLVLIVAVPRAIAIVSPVVAVASAILRVALGVGLPLVIVLSLLAVFAVTSTVFSHTLARGFALGVAVVDAIILHIVTATVRLILVLNI